MWILVMFDLPVGTHEQSRAASKFREFLLDEGYEMARFSIYARFCSGKEQYEAFVRHIEAHLPDKGDVHILGFTDRQYENIIRFSGQARKRQQKTPANWPFFDGLGCFSYDRCGHFSISFKRIATHPS